MMNLKQVQDVTALDVLYWHRSQFVERMGLSAVDCTVVITLHPALWKSGMLYPAKGRSVKNLRGLVLSMWMERCVRNIRWQH